jgi:acetylornithine/succinyldiaminopimelate/putrescine aminotransferase
MCMLMLRVLFQHEQEKCDVFKPGDHASTFGGNPLACAAGLVVASRITDGGLLENVKVRVCSPLVLLLCS